MSDPYENIYELVTHLQNMKDGSGATLSVPKALYCMAKEIAFLRCPELRSLDDWTTHYIAERKAQEIKTEKDLAELNE